MNHYISSDNQSRADNQQGRLDPWWIVGFADGEGCFSVSIFKNSTTKSGVQVFPEFVITQGEKSLNTLEDLQRYFNCGNIYINRRSDNHRENLYRYCVRSMKDLEDNIVPFFNKYQLKTAKNNDFVIFCKILILLKGKEHLNKSGLDNIKSLASTMNRRKTRI